MNSKTNNNDENTTIQDKKVNETECIQENSEKSDKCANSKKKKEKNDEAAKKLIAEMLEENDKIKKELAEQKDIYIRTLAEYDNYRKRTAAEKSKIYSDSVADTVEKMLPVLDNLERAVSCPAENDDAKAIRSGVELVLRSFKETLEKLDVSEIPALGETFDPNLHNAVMREDNPEKGEGEITEVFSKGYRIGNKVIRYSMVKVAN